MAIETLTDLNAQACCCDLTPCPVPALNCQSVSASLNGAGYIDPDDTSWTVYKKQGYTMAASSNQTDVIDSPGDWYDGLTSQIRTVSVNTFDGFAYSHLYEGGICLNPECLCVTPTAEQSCSASGTSSRTNYAQFTWGPGGINEVNDVATIRTNTLSNAEGDETLFHIAWRELVATYGPDELTAIAAWEADYAAWQAEVVAHDAWLDAVSTYATWESVRDTHDDWEAAVAAHAAWQALKDAHDAWELNPVGDEPPMEGDEPPMAGEEPEEEGEEPPLPGEEPEVRLEPTEPYAEPTPEFYGPCHFKITTTFEVKPHAFGYNSDGSSPADPADNATVQAWYEAGGVGLPATPGTATIIDYAYITGVLSAMDESISGDAGTPFVDVYGLTEPTGFSAWMALAEGVIDGVLNFEEPLCLQSECSSFFAKSTEPEQPDPVGSFVFHPNDAALEKRSARVQFQIPALWSHQNTGLDVAFTGTYFKFTYDIIEEPTGWDDPVPTVFRTFVSEDNVLEWTGPGSGAPSDPSWFTTWITLDPPTVPGIRRIVNIRLVCRENWFVGVVPQVTGDAVTLPDP